MCQVSFGPADGRQKLSIYFLSSSKQTAVFIERENAKGKGVSDINMKDF